MGNAAITGTATSTGGVIMPSAYNQLLTIEGSTVALIGDYASCQCGLSNCKKVGPIVANPALPRAVFYKQIPWALAGDFVATGCGLCTILESPHEVMVGHDMSSAVHIPAGVKISIVNGMSFNMGPAPAPPPSVLKATQTATHAATMATSTSSTSQATASHSATYANGATGSTQTQTTADGWKVVQGISPDKPLLVYQTQKKMLEELELSKVTDSVKLKSLLDGINPPKDLTHQELKDFHQLLNEVKKLFATITQSTRKDPNQQQQFDQKLKKLEAAILPADLKHGDKNKEEIMKYGWQHPFKDKLNLKFNHAGFINQAEKEDQFTLKAEEHFKRMRNLGDRVVMMVGFSMYGGTSDIFYDMVDKFERKEGGFFHNDDLTDAMKKHETTKHFHEALKTCLRQNITPNGSLPPDNQLQAITSDYLANKAKVSLPKFGKVTFSKDLTNGTVLTVHDIWAMQVYITQLEYKDDEIKGVFHYKIEDHFGLNASDINHPDLKSFSINHPIKSSKDIALDMLHKYELIEGFRSWYILQHYEGYNYKPFTTQMNFTLT